MLVSFGAALPETIAVHGYRYLQPNLEDLNMAVVEMSDGASAFIYHNWLFPENTAKLTVVGSKKMLLYEGKFEKRAVTMYEYAVEEDCGHGDLVEERTYCRRQFHPKSLPSTHFLV